MRTNDVKQLTKEQDLLEEKNNKSEISRKRCEECLFGLSEKTEMLFSMFAANIEKTEKGMRGLKALDSRLNFANERLRVVRGILQSPLLISNKINRYRLNYN